MSPQTVATLEEELSTICARSGTDSSGICARLDTSIVKFISNLAAYVQALVKRGIYRLIQAMCVIYRKLAISLQTL